MTYLLTFAGFAALIILHEAGHFVAAKAVGMRVERFSLFFGRLIVKVRRGETEYGVAWLPLGGYVKITGMNPEEVTPEAVELDRMSSQLRQTLGELDDPRYRDDEPALLTLRETARRQEADVERQRAATEAVKARAYYNQPPWKRIVVILAGPFVNLLVGFLILFGIYLSLPTLVTHHGQPVSRGTVIEAVESGKPAAGALRAGDRIVAVDGSRDVSENALVAAISGHRCAGAPVNGCSARTPVTLTVRRSGTLHTLRIRPQYDASAKRMEIGFEMEIVPVTTGTGVVPAAHASVSEMWTVTSETVSRIAQVFRAQDRKQFHGVVGAVDILHQEFSYSTTEALGTLALISLSLAIVNLFPFLPLDGGHVFWAVAEKVRRRRIPFAVMERAGIVGFLLILAVFAIGLSNDISGIANNTLNLPH